MGYKTLQDPQFAGLANYDPRALFAQLPTPAYVIDEERLRDHEPFMVTTRDIDQQVRDLSKVVGYGINWALQDLEIEEMNALLS